VESAKKTVVCEHHPLKKHVFGARPGRTKTQVRERRRRERGNSEILASKSGKKDPKYPKIYVEGAKYVNPKLGENQSRKNACFRRASPAEEH